MPEASAIQHSSSGWAKRYGPFALVTGASDGIGRAFARALAARGVSVVLVARRVERLEALALELNRDHNVQARVVAADLATAQGVDAVLEATAHLDVGLLVTAAGFGSSGPLIEADLDVELAMVGVNCGAVVQLSHAFGNRLRARGSGGIVLLSSLLAFQGVPRASTYAATKAFVQTFGEGLRLELAPHGVDVVASAPGPVASGFAERADMKMGATDRPETVAAVTLGSLGRRGTVRPGWLSKLLEYSLCMLPRVVRTRILGAVMQGMTKHQDAPSPRAA